MDQASSLRELMNKQQAAVSPVAVLSTGDVFEKNDFLKRMTVFLSKKNHKKITLAGLKGKEEMNLEYCVKNNLPVENIKKNLYFRANYIPGSLAFLSKIRKNNKLIQNFVELMREIERESECVIYYAGEAGDTTAVNLALTTNNVLILAKPTASSFTEVINLAKIFHKTQANKSAGLIMDTDDTQAYQEQANKIQDLCWREFKYYIEPVGCLQTKSVAARDEQEMFENFKFDCVTRKKDVKVFSDAVKKILL